MFAYLCGESLVGAVCKKKLDDLGVVFLRGHVERREAILQQYIIIIDRIRHWPD